MEVNLRTDAEQDLTDAAVWYEEQRPGLGGEFLDEVFRTITLIGENPAMFPDVHRGIRRRRRCHCERERSNPVKQGSDGDND